MKSIIRTIALLAIVSISFTSANDLIYNKHDTIRKASSIVYDKKTDKPITGTIVIKFATGEIWRTVPYINGKENGIEKWYFKPNILRYEISNKNGLQDGVTKEYDKNGKLISETIYKNDEEVKYDFSRRI